MSEYRNRNIRFEISPTENKIFKEIFGDTDISTIAKECLVKAIKEKSNSDQLFRLNTKTDKGESKWS